MKKVGMASRKQEILDAHNESQKEIRTLKKQLKNFESDPVEKELPTPSPKVSESVPTTHEVDIRPDSLIQVISLCPHILTLSVSQNGKSFRFRKLGEKKRILYRDLMDIVEHMPTFAESGTFYILNPDVVRMHGLEDHYNSVLTESDMNKVVYANADTAFEVFKTANEKQQHFIAEILLKKIMQEEDPDNPIDMNFVRMVERELGIDIIQKAEESMVYKEAILKEA